MAANASPQTPFMILIDTAEQHPFRFTGLTTPRPGGVELPLHVRTQPYCLGRHPESFGDYSIQSTEMRFADGRIKQASIHGPRLVAVERKSVADLQTTILGFGDGHRERFEAELANLDTCEAALVLVEGSEPDVWSTAPQWGVRTAAENAITLQRSILAYRQDYPRVQWSFAGSRRLAELTCYHWLRRWWESAAQRSREDLRRAAAETAVEAIQAAAGQAALVLQELL